MKTGMQNLLKEYEHVASSMRPLKNKLYTHETGMQNLLKEHEYVAGSM
jgi:hypothetical protein